MPFFPSFIENHSEINVRTDNIGETCELGYELGKRVKPGTIILLAGDLGSGKTTFVQGLAKGLGVPDSYYVTSPTYTIVNEYPGRLPLFHMDLYRISDPEELYDIGIDEIFSSDGIIAVEWPERLPEEGYQANIHVRIAVNKGDSRIFTFTFSDVDLIS